MGITDNMSSATISAAKDLTDRCTRIDIHLNGRSSLGLLVKVQVTRRVGCPCITVLCTSVNRVGCIETATIELTDNQWQTAVLIDIHRDGAVDATTLVVTTEDATELTTGHCQRDITINRCVLGTAKHLRDKLLGHTLQRDIDITIHWSYLSGTIDFMNLQGTAVRLISLQ